MINFSRNAFIFLVDVFPSAKTASGRRSLFHLSAEARSPRVRIAWEDCQASRDRNAIYGYLSAVFDLVMWWAAEDRAISRARWALQLQGWTCQLPTNRLPRSSCAPPISESRQANAIEMVACAPLSGRVQIACRIACRVRSAERWDQRVCCAVYPSPWATRSKLSVQSVDGSRHTLRNRDSHLPG